jgi:hypothetical protein
MAGTRGISSFRGEQLRSKLLRDGHFDVNNKINENKIDLKWAQHREILEDTKIDVFIQKNNVAVGAGTSFIEVTADITNKTIAVDTSTEGVVLTEKAILRKTGTEDFPFIDADGDKVYGKLRHVPADGEDPEAFFLDFYSVVGGTEQAYTFASAVNVDYKYVNRTNMSIVPANAIINAGSAFVEGATDAKAYMNLNQLMKDLYGAGGTLDGDGNANLGTNIVTQIANEIDAREDADQEIRDDFAATTGAGLVGVITDTNYTGLTVQAVLSNLAQRLKAQETLNDGIATRDADTANGYFQEGDFTTAEGRIDDLEAAADAAFKAQHDRLTVLEQEDQREVYESDGSSETGYTLLNGPAKPNTLFVALNSALQVPGLHYDEVLDVNDNVVGISFAPDTLKVVEGVPDNLFLWYKKVL